MNAQRFDVPLEVSFFLYVSNAFTSPSSSRSLFTLALEYRGLLSGLPVMLQGCGVT